MRAAAYQNPLALDFARGPAKVRVQKLLQRYPSVEDPLNSDEWWSPGNEVHEDAIWKAFMGNEFENTPKLLDDLTDIVRSSGKDMVGLLKLVYEYYVHGEKLQFTGTESSDALINALINAICEGYRNNNAM